MGAKHCRAHIMGFKMCTVMGCGVDLLQTCKSDFHKCPHTY